ncbi:MAG TPA: NosD domain-containing protein, partial [Aggregatilineales bacterium]|nr:NosD domain-containing protein [Aggregatilineales bacterium]
DGNLYGLHFMYSDNATIQRNTISNNSVGIYMMYSENIIANDNSILWNRGASGYGIAFKDSNYIQVENNALIGNQSGVYIDNSPMLPDIITLFKGNFFAYNDIGISALPSVARNAFQGNAFIDNIQQASTLGRGDMLKNIWQVDGIGNYWSDYVGYDSDGDGIGDVSYRVEKLFENLTDEYPMLRLFTYSPASQSLNFAAVAFPSLRPDPKVIDEAPMMHYTVPAHIAQNTPTVSISFLVVSLMLLGIGGAIYWFTVNPIRFNTASRTAHDPIQGAK